MLGTFEGIFRVKIVPCVLSVMLMLKPVLCLTFTLESMASSDPLRLTEDKLPCATASSVACLSWRHRWLLPKDLNVPDLERSQLLSFFTTL